MKMTKTEIKKAAYNKYGITYENDHIKTPIGPMKELLKTGNTKTGKAVLTWSMNTTTCPCQCKGCYATKGCYNFSDVKQSLLNNTIIARDYPDFFKKALFAQLETLKDGTEIRIHAAGDFFNDQYLNTWVEAVKAFPNLIFWTYTKRRNYENAFDDFNNANIVKSIIPGHGFNFGHCKYIIDTYNDLINAGERVHICKCGIDPDHHCAGCHKCSEYKYVLFIEHSTEYKAVEDPYYNDVVTLINNQ